MISFPPALHSLAKLLGHGKGLLGSIFGGGRLACSAALEALHLIDELIPQAYAVATYPAHELDALRARSEEYDVRNRSLPPPMAKHVSRKLTGLIIPLEAP